MHSMDVARRIGERAIEQAAARARGDSRAPGEAILATAALGRGMIDIEAARAERESAAMMAYRRWGVIINSYLRGEDWRGIARVVTKPDAPLLNRRDEHRWEDSLGRWVADLDAIVSLRTATTIMGWRAVGEGWPPVHDGERMVGRTYVEGGFVSVSVGGLTPVNGYAIFPVWCRVVVPRGTPAFYIGGPLRELVVARSSHYRITSLDRFRSGRLLVDVELLRQQHDC